MIIRTTLAALLVGATTLGLAGSAEPLAPPEKPPEFQAQVLAGARDYKEFGQVMPQGRWSPLLCDAPPIFKGQGAYFSDSTDAQTHGKKIYLLYAKKMKAGSYAL